jgi:UDP-2,3-diacylglucosamine pyrophosphatase LpxH
MASIRRIRPLSYRAIFVSDIHLGFPGCSASYLLDFLRSTRCDFLYLVGDIIDLWQMKKRVYWPQAHNDVVRTVLGKAKHGTRVIYVPGNHDELLRDFDGTVLGNLEIRNRIVHVTMTGKRLLITHGDEFDGVIKHSPMVALIGSAMYEFLLKANRVLNYTRRKLGFSYWSLASVLKHKVKQAVNYISNFETALAHEARRARVDGLICGHIHRAQIECINGVLYCNCGDWVESCTALVENHDGTLELIHWSDTLASLKRHEIAA